MGFGEFLDGVVIYFAQHMYFIKRDIFVGLVDGYLFAGKLGAERAPVFQGSCVRAATDSNRRIVFARCRVIYAGERRNQVAVYVVVQGG